MASQNQPIQVMRFDAYEVHLRAGELYKAGRKIKLQVQPFQVLAILLECPGQVVTREELQKRLWPADTFVDFDHSLNTAIKKLRLALSDDKKKPRFVETLPKRGYRFIGTLQQCPERPPAPAIASVSINTSTSSPNVGRVAKLATGGKPAVALVSIDEATAAEREKLDAANDDVGLSLLIAAHRLFLLPDGTPLRILEFHEATSRCQVRILEGEHYGKTALVPLHLLDEIT